MKKEKSKLLLVMLLCITMIGTTLLSACSGEQDPEEPPAPPANSLTGETAEQGQRRNAPSQGESGFPDLQQMVHEASEAEQSGPCYGKRLFIQSLRAFSSTSERTFWNSSEG